ncbi:thioredoxin-dependent thiol peroxidase [Rhizobium sp. SSA_523]|uniref:thioredoxin-dependent thiol peroxidase n=1 Tax=Rhizobium sp. SSA_523 TaxID=2952477 RepID=UPI00209039C2|nr:thioredoxin-dependent thiol peroxidase [Rhizobium sp. SSA_523]MCO5729944.1 thioredoxin-dependent thiol peroxidase [Rhizobium sp. SSA_523]WKC25024.1 thioredoxin-dependent thiol peroxidase [Rhizobium sp. SSA_523]
MSELSVGATAPDFTLARDGGGTVSLSDFRGKPVIVYFYPKDDTSGCTVEALDFTARASDFAAVGATVLGISPDPVARHDKFIKKHDLRVVLLSDEEQQAANAYGVWKEKSMYGRTYMGIERSTFLVDADGKLSRIWNKVKVAGHADEVLEAVKAL